MPSIAACNKKIKNKVKIVQLPFTHTFAHTNFTQQQYQIGKIARASNSGKEKELENCVLNAIILSDGRQ